MRFEQIQEKRRDRIIDRPWMATCGTGAALTTQFEIEKVRACVRRAPQGPKKPSKEWKGKGKGKGEGGGNSLPRNGCSVELPRIMAPVAPSPA